MCVVGGDCSCGWGCCCCCDCLYHCDHQSPPTPSSVPPSAPAKPKPTHSLIPPTREVENRRASSRGKMGTKQAGKPPSPLSTRPRMREKIIRAGFLKEKEESFYSRYKKIHQNLKTREIDGKNRTRMGETTLGYKRPPPPAPPLPHSPTIQSHTRPHHIHRMRNPQTLYTPRLLLPPPSPIPQSPSP